MTPTGWVAGTQKQRRHSPNSAERMLLGNGRVTRIASKLTSLLCLFVSLLFLTFFLNHFLILYFVYVLKTIRE